MSARVCKEMGLKRFSEAAAKTLLRGSVATRRLRLKEHFSWVSKYNLEPSGVFVRLG
jgi:hypothetical protein